MELCRIALRTDYQISSISFWLYGQQKFKYEGYGATVALPERWPRMPLALEKSTGQYLSPSELSAAENPTLCAISQMRCKAEILELASLLEKQDAVGADEFESLEYVQKVRALGIAEKWGPSLPTANQLPPVAGYKMYASEEKIVAGKSDSVHCVR